jgi:hypothetical protein
MRSVVVGTFALFLGILLAAWVASERARPAIIDVDPAEVGAKGR